MEPDCVAIKSSLVYSSYNSLWSKAEEKSERSRRGRDINHTLEMGPK